MAHGLADEGAPMTPADRTKNGAARSSPVRETADPLLGAAPTSPSETTSLHPTGTRDLNDAAGLLWCVRTLHRRSLDRGRFWNVAAQSNVLLFVTAECARDHRTREAEHRQRLKAARRELTWGARDRDRKLITAEVRRWVVESELLTEALRGVLVTLSVEDLPKGLETLRNRSPWFDSVIDANRCRT